MQKDLLIEIGTEELPPKSLMALSEAFHSGVCSGLENRGLKYLIATPFATPRRLAVLVKGLEITQPTQIIEKRGPALQAAFDKTGKPTKAAEGFARSCGVEVSQLEKLETDKGSWLVHKVEQIGKTTVELVAEIVNQALASLPIAKRMRWGDKDFEFVRPVHWVVLLFDDQIIDAEIMGAKSNRTTRGHRFHCPEELSIDHAANYQKILKEQGHVIPVFSERQARVELLVKEAAEQYNGEAIIDEELLKEVASLVEYPVPVVGKFEEQFLEVPPEALISVMKGHQRYFHLVNKETGKLLPYFITLSNIESRQPELVQAGNERVIRPRLTDAMFFWKQDCTVSLESRLETLKTVTFENKLGSLYEKSMRVSKLASFIAKQLQTDENKANRAGKLCKCDLLSGLVGEFPELQGIMGEYYAKNDKEPVEVAQAIREHYLPRFAGDELPISNAGQAVALADRLDTLVGIFGVGKIPSGDKDPYGLRRAAIGLLRILIERNLPLDIEQLIKESAANYPEKLLASETVELVYNFVIERMRAYYFDISPDSIEAVLCCRPTKPLDAHLRIRSVEEFRKSVSAAALAEANKRIHNILKKVEETISDKVEESALQEISEKELYQLLQSLAGKVESAVKSSNYQAALKEISTLKEPLDAFFTNVMVMVEDVKVRQNRLALLQSLRNLFLQVADISKLQFTK
jgi:glycyl-tRNA synthetase beta chain